MATTTTNTTTTTKSISIPNNNNIGNTKTTKKTFYSTLLNSELQSYKYNTDQSNKKEEKKKNTISNTNVKKNIPTRARRNSPFQMKINTNNGNNKSRFKSLSISFFSPCSLRYLSFFEAYRIFGLFVIIILAAHISF